MKKLSKEQIEKRNRVKQYLLRSLHIICYILSALFIIVCISVGVQSCNSKKKGVQIQKQEHQLRLNKPINYQYDYYLLSFESSSFTANVPWLRGLAPNIEFVEGTVAKQAYQEYNYGVNGAYLIDTEGNKIEISRLRVGFSSYQNVGDSLYYYRLNRAFWVLENGDNFVFIQKHDNSTPSAFDFNYDIYREYSDISSSLMVDYDFSVSNFTDISFNYFYFKVTGLNDYVMSYSLDYYWWVGSNSKFYDNNVDIIFNSVFTSSSTIYRKYINMPYFMSNNRLYNQIELIYYGLAVEDPNGVPWRLNDGSVASHITPTTGYGYFRTMRYVNTDTSAYDDVYQRPEITWFDSNNDPKWALSDNCSWLNSSWRYITIFSDIEVGSDTYMDLIGLNSQSTLSNYVGGTSDIFLLLKTTFQSIMPVLSIAILPNFTIGMLLCIPLAVTTIIVIVKLVKK